MAAVRVGIPRALMYYDYYPMWKTFFEELGADVVLSDRTAKPLMNDGINACVDEACLPVKLFHGHVINLKDRVDYLFIPRLKSIAKGEYICPKFIGLPEMIRFSIKDLPPIIDTEINLRKKITNLYPAYKTIASYINQNSVAIKNAYKAALRIQQDFHKNVQDGRYPVEILEGTSIHADSSADLCIALIGHPYNLYDSHVSMNILSKLQNDGIKVITPDLLSDDLIDRAVEQLPKQMFWSAGKKLIGCALHLIDRTDIDGVIYLMSFGCGIDAFVSDLCERKIRRNKSSPFFLLTLDEHSGEAGFNTRLEAFIDMIRWRKRNESNISTHG